MAPDREFQSTLSVRRATAYGRLKNHPENISIHALRKESDADALHLGLGEVISIHALRKESDGFRFRGADRQGISIHALRKESDS